MRKTILSLSFVLLSILYSAADTYTIVFQYHNGSDATTTVSLPDEIIKDGSDLVSGLTATSVYLGKTGYGVKLGTGTKKGGLQLFLSDTFQPTKMTLRAAIWTGSAGQDSENITVNGETIKLLGTDLQDYDITCPELLSEITISAAKASKNRFYVHSITFEAPDPHPYQVAIIAPTLCDFGFLDPGTDNVSIDRDIEVKGKRLKGNIRVTIANDKEKVFSLRSNATLPTAGGTISLSAAATKEGIYTANLLLSSFDEHGMSETTITRLVLKVISRTDHQGTAADPYTVTDALYAAMQQKEGTATDSVFVRGIVRGQVSLTQGEADFLLADSISEIKVYKMTAYGQDMLDQSMLHEGDTLLIHTVLDNHRYTYRLYKGKLISTQISFTDWETLQEGYYDEIDNLQDEDLKWTLSKVIYSPIRYTYGSGQRSTWAGFYYTDRDTATNLVLDMYSDNQRFFNTEEPTASVKDMDIEHMFPKSWWGGEVNEAYQDLHHLVPADYSANRSKSNLPPGIVANATFDNGSFKTGTAADDCPADKVFEPADEYKGDFARAYFYIATAYTDYTWDMATNAASAMDNTSYLELQPWLYEILLQWHRQDPVSEKEIRRQKAVARIQHNRNPFIDYPCLVEYIWGTHQTERVNLSFLLFTDTDAYRTSTDKSGCDCFCQDDAIETITTPRQSARLVFVSEGTLIIEQGKKIYSLTGMDMTNANGQLPQGIYIVK